MNENLLLFAKDKDVENVGYAVGVVVRVEVVLVSVVATVLVTVDGAGVVLKNLSVNKKCQISKRTRIDLASNQGVPYFKHSTYLH